VWLEGGKLYGLSKPALVAHLQTKHQERATDAVCAAERQQRQEAAKISGFRACTTCMRGLDELVDSFSVGS
jgi:hypothetical protein